MFKKKSGKQMKLMIGHSGKVNSLCIGGKFLYSASDDKTIIKWDIKVKKNNWEISF